MRTLLDRIGQHFLSRRHSTGQSSTVIGGKDRHQAIIDRLQRELQQWQLGWPPGHFYSPLPAIDEIRQQEEAIFGSIPRTLPGIDLNETEQLHLLKQLSSYYPSHPFKDEKQDHLRYYFNNPNYSYGEAIVLYCMIRRLRPKRIIEVGSGYSSGVILDTNEQAFQNTIDCTFIEPYPELLLSLLSTKDRARVRIIDKKVQDVEDSVFAELGCGDILFIDSSHVSKVHSDVNHLFFNVLPRLAPGVFVHFHDIGYPFEYPKEWIYQGRAWNEAYLLRSFLQYNSAFRIEFFNSFLGQFHHDALHENMELSTKNPGTSIWLQRIDHHS